jgi:hypothetical protein
MATLVLRKNTVHFDSNTHAPVAGFEKGERDDKGMLFVLIAYVLLKGYRKTP